jgi:hypothetical protein
MWSRVLEICAYELVEFEMGYPSKIAENSPFQIGRQIEIGWPPLNVSKRFCSSPLDKVWP